MQKGPLLQRAEQTRGRRVITRDPLPLLRPLPTDDRAAEVALLLGRQLTLTAKEGLQGSQDQTVGEVLNLKMCRDLTTLPGLHGTKHELLN
eukprot:5582606-Pyramimonas_sp.AAC.1